MSRYDQGRRLEWAARDALTAAGYLVLRSAGSKTPVDLAAWRPGEHLFVQCKLDGYLTPAARAKFIRLSEDLGPLPIVARWRKEGRAARTVEFAYLYEDGDSAPWNLTPWRNDDGLAAG